jgi:intracellular sulfur oxidation DsrE/DsrF family protein
MSLKFTVTKDVEVCIPSNKTIRDKHLFLKGQTLELIGYGVTVCPCEYTIKYKVLDTEQVIEVITSTYYGFTPFVQALSKI